MNKTKLGVWIICENPECQNNEPDHAFLVPYMHRDRRFCSVKCAAIVRSNTPEFKKRAGEKLAQYNKVRHILYPEWDKNNKEVVRNLVIERNKTPEMRALSGRRLSKANRERKELYPDWDANCKNAVSNLFKNPEFMEAHKRRSSKTMLRLNHDDADFMRRRNERASAQIIKFNRNSEYAEARRQKIQKQFREGAFGRAQRLLFSRLIELVPELESCLSLEEVISLSEDIVCRYPGSNRACYMIDIAFSIDNTVVFAVEVDGVMGHSSEEDIIKDKVRDSILLNEFNIPTFRVSNDDVFKGVDIVVFNVLTEFNNILQCLGCVEVTNLLPKKLGIL